jgi:hypothetical protein
MVKTRKRSFMVCIVVCTVLLLLSTEFQQTPVVLAATSTISIVAYGSEAQTVASRLSEMYPSDQTFSFDSQSPVIVVVSDINLIDIQSVSNSVKNGAILVAINLPEDNGLIDAPRHTLSSSRSINGRVISETLHENVVSPYWIVVTKQTEPPFTGQYNGGNADDEQSHEVIMQHALEGIKSALFPDADYPSRPEIINNSDVNYKVRVVYPIFGRGLAVLVIAALFVGLYCCTILLLRRKPKV